MKTHKNKTHKNKLSNIIIATLKIVNILVAVVFVISAYGGYINPLETTMFAVLGMFFPIMLIIMALLLILWLVLRQWKAVIFCMSMMAFCAVPLVTYFPVNIGSPAISEKEKESEFTLLTYNIMHFSDFEEGKSKVYNRTMKYIRECDADIVCLQECENLNPIPYYDVTQKQVDSLKQQYKYYQVGVRDLTILSKHPIDTTPHPVPKVIRDVCQAVKITINEKPVYVINVHLQSIGLTLTDKELYLDVTSIDNVEKDILHARSTISAIRYKLLSKLSEAFRQRARQSQAIKRYLEKLDGQVILCGDFNDTPSSYSYRTVRGDMKDAYLECAFGPTITYHDNRFYFKIDHVFYRGNIEAVDIKRGDNYSSDHYSLFTTFVMKEEQLN